MPRPRLLVNLIAAALVAAAAAIAHAAPVRTAHVEAELVSERSALVPGEPLTVALRLAMDRGWHTYWQNPGDSGLPTTLAWKVPARHECRTDTVAGAAGPARRSAGQLRVRRRSAAADRYRDHRRHRRSADGHAGRARRLAGVQGSLHSRRRGSDADPAGRAARAARPRRPMRGGAPRSPGRARRFRARSAAGTPARPRTAPSSIWS